jgi:hypothetical protein
VLQFWAEELRKKGPENIGYLFFSDDCANLPLWAYFITVLAVVANKCDLVDDEVISYTEAKSYADVSEAYYYS